MKKFINWLKAISKNPLVQKFYFIAFIALCVYLIIPKWQVSHQGSKTFVVNKFTGEVQDANILKRQISDLEFSKGVLGGEVIRLKKRVNELVNFINTAHFEKTSDSKFDIKQSINIEPEQ